MKGTAFIFCAIIFLVRTAKGQELLFNFQTKEFSTTNFGKRKTIPYKSDLKVTVFNIKLEQYDPSVEVDRINYTYVKDNIEEEPENANSKYLESSKLNSLQEILSYESIEDTSTLDSLRAYMESFDFTDELNLLEEKRITVSSKLEVDSFVKDFKERFDTKKKKFEDAFWRAKALAKKMEDSSGVEVFQDIYDDANEASSLLRKIQKQEFSASLFITNIEDDEIVINLNIKRRDTEELTSTYSYSIGIRGKLKIDFSSGAIFNIGLSDRNYEIQGDSLVNTGNENSVIPIFPTVLMHAYRRSYEDVTWGASFGFGISNENKINYYAGLGFFLGDRQRLALSIGMALRQVKKLKAQYRENQSFSSGNLPTIDNLTSEPYRLGGFFAITYNLSSIKN